MPNVAAHGRAAVCASGGADGYAIYLKHQIITHGSKDIVIDSICFKLQPYLKIETEANVDPNNANPVHTDNIVPNKISSKKEVLLCIPGFKTKNNNINAISPRKEKTANLIEIAGNDGFPIFAIEIVAHEKISNTIDNSENFSLKVKAP